MGPSSGTSFIALEWVTSFTAQREFEVPNWKNDTPYGVKEMKGSNHETCYSAKNNNN